MPRSRDFLQRFRPAGTPGAASKVGVPADRVAETSAELEPVFVRLVAAQAQADRIRADGAREAERRLAEATQRSQELVARARRRASAERADAALRATRDVEREGAAAMARAEQEAAEVGRRAAERLPAYRARVLAAGRDALRADGAGR